VEGALLFERRRLTFALPFKSPEVLLENFGEVWSSMLRRHHLPFLWRCHAPFLFQIPASTLLFRGLLPIVLQLISLHVLKNYLEIVAVGGVRRVRIILGWHEMRNCAGS
jgi:hypothetical protein